MIAFFKEGSRASFLALKTSRSQYLWWETKHSEEEPCSGKMGAGGAEDKPALQGALWLPIDAG